MANPALSDLAYAQQIKKEMWPLKVGEEFKDALSKALEKKEPSEEHRLSKHDLERLILLHRNDLELKESQQKALKQVMEPIDTLSGLIWKDRSH
jgi:hypothetical protein